MNILKLRTFENELHIPAPGDTATPDINTTSSGSNGTTGTHDNLDGTSNPYESDNRPNTPSTPPLRTPEQIARDEVEAAQEAARVANEIATRARDDARVADDELRTAEDELADFNDGLANGGGNNITNAQQTRLTELENNVSVAAAESVDANEVAAGASQVASDLDREALNYMVVTTEPVVVGIDLTTSPSPHPADSAPNASESWWDIAGDYLTSPYTGGDIHVSDNNEPNSIYGATLNADLPSITPCHLHAADLINAAEQVGVELNVDELKENCETLFDPSSGEMGPEGTAFFVALDGYQDPAVVVDMPPEDFQSYIDDLREQTMYRIHQQGADPAMASLVHEHTESMTEAHGYFVELNGEIDYAVRQNLIADLQNEIATVEPDSSIAIEQIQANVYLQQFEQEARHILETYDGFEFDGIGQMATEPGAEDLAQLSLEEQELVTSIQALQEARFTGRHTVEEAQALTERVDNAIVAYQGRETPSLDANNPAPYTPEHAGLVQTLEAGAHRVTVARDNLEEARTSGNVETLIGALAESVDANIAMSDYHQRQSYSQRIDENGEKWFDHNKKAAEDLQDELDELKQAEVVQQAELNDMPFNVDTGFATTADATGTGPVAAVSGIFNEAHGYMDAANQHEHTFQRPTEIGLEDGHTSMVRGFAEGAGHLHVVGRDVSVIANPLERDIGAPTMGREWEHDVPTTAA